MSDNEDHEESEEELEESEYMGDDDAVDSIGKAPQCTFGIRWNRNAFISKKHSEAEPGLDSPGVGDYKLGRELLDPKAGAHFGTATKDLQPTRYDGPITKGTAHNGPGPKYNAMPTEYRAIPAYSIGSSKRPPLSRPTGGPGPAAYLPEKPPKINPPEHTFGKSPEQDRFAITTHQFMGKLAAEALPVIDTPGPIYQVGTDLNESGANFDHAERFNKEYEDGNPASNQYDTRGTFGAPPNKPRYAATRNPPEFVEPKKGVYMSGEGKRFSQKQFMGKGAPVGKGLDGNGPGSSTVPDTTMKTNGPKFPQAPRNVGAKNHASQVPGPGAYKPPLSVGGNYQGKGIGMACNRKPKPASEIGPGPNAFHLFQEAGVGKPKVGFVKGSRHPKVYISKKHTQDVKGLDSPGPAYHYQRATDFGTGMSSVIGTADRNKSEAKRFISKLHTADVKGVGVPGPGAYGASPDEKVYTGGCSFGRADRSAGMTAPSTRTPGPAAYVKPSTLKKGGCSFGGGKSRV